MPTEVGGRRLRSLLRTRSRWLAFLAVLGPGLIAASADNDAQGITTYTLAGAKTGYELLWVLVLVVFALVVTQEIGARLGMATGKGLSALIRERYGVKAVAWAMGLLLIANLGTITAEFAGIAAAMEIFHVSKFFSVPVAAVAVFLLITRGSYRRVERVFLVLSVVFVSYIVSGILAHPDWGAAARGALVPSIHGSKVFLLAAITIVGTTVTPWGQFFIQAYVVDKGLTAGDLRNERLDVFTGSFVMGVIAFFIMVAAASTIFATGKTVNDAADLAIALRPLAGRFASTLFAIGFLNASFLAACVLPLSTAYPVCEAFGFELGVDRRLSEAPAFYGVVAFSIAFGAGIVLLPIPLLPILFLTALLEAILLGPILIFLYQLANDPEVIGDLKNGRVANVLAIGVIVLLLGLTVLTLVVALFPSG
jgi:NRAMP (natural resistance-associated macrophage protein)-like metal ion transporter